MSPATVARLALDGALDGPFLISTRAELAGLAVAQAASVAEP
jgi:hypothetical protein